MVACGRTEETPKADNEASDAPAKEDASAASAESAEPAEKNKSLSILWTGTGNGEMANEAVAERLLPLALAAWPCEFPRGFRFPGKAVDPIL